MSCVAHSAISSILFHTVRVTEHTALPHLSSLLLRFGAEADAHKRRAPAYAIRFLSYTSNSASVDRDAIPLLCSVLGHATSLQFLRISVPTRSTSRLVSAMEGSGVIRTSPCPVLTMWHMADGRHDRCGQAVPYMGGVHVTSIDLLRGLLAFRSLRAVILDDSVCGVGLCDFLRECGAGGPLKSLRSFSCCADTESVLYILDDLQACSPMLEHLALQVSTDVMFPITPALHLMTVRVRSLSFVPLHNCFLSGFDSGRSCHPRRF